MAGQGRPPKATPTEDIKTVGEDVQKTKEQICRERKMPYYDETKHWTRFNFLEQPHQRLDFCFGKTIWNEKRQRKGTHMEKYSLMDGESYELPQYIIDHLNSKTVPDPYFEKMQNGMIRSHHNRRRNRFSCNPTPKPQPVKKEVIYGLDTGQNPG